MDIPITVMIRPMATLTPATTEIRATPGIRITTTRITTGIMDPRPTATPGILTTDIGMELATAEGITRIPARGIVTRVGCITVDSADQGSMAAHREKRCAALTSLGRELSLLSRRVHCLVLSRPGSVESGIVGPETDEEPQAGESPPPHSDLLETNLAPSRFFCAFRVLASH